MMETLQDLATQYSRAPKMMDAINRAIDANGADAPAIIVGGQPSYRRGTNMYRACTERGWTNWRYYAGARRQYATQGCYYICVPTSGNCLL
jgi:hypothetical protein